MSIEEHFDIPFVAALALKEKQIQQKYRPIIAVHKWFARRPGTLFRALLLSEFGNTPLADSFFQANDFAGRLVADPFMGGGTPVLEANRVGCDVIGVDINPMSAWIVREEIEELDLAAYHRAASALISQLEEAIGQFLVTDCPLYGDRDVPVKYFLWVKVLNCESCGQQFDLFPGYLLADDSRHPRNVLVCPACGELNEVDSTLNPGRCHRCEAVLEVVGPARRGRCACFHCGHENRYPRASEGVPRHRMFAVEYFNPRRKQGHAGRFFKQPDAKDLERAANAAARLQTLTQKFIPDDLIMSGEETDRLHRWGYRQYRDLFNDRQLLGLEISCRAIVAVEDQRVRRALATNLSDLLRYQNMLCRYDTTALKSLDVFSVHGFPVGLVQCESNLLGTVSTNGTTVGSGGWTNMVQKYATAKEYCDAPYEVFQARGGKVVIPIQGEWIGRERSGQRKRIVTIRCASSTQLSLPPKSLDAVLTDPPYFGNVQYAELMDFCYVWLRRIADGDAEILANATTRSPQELTGNATENRGLEHFTDGLSCVFQSMARALKLGGPLAFTFHHNRIEAYFAVGVAILDAGLHCSATLPCPAEMGGSIHIHGTGSSIVDSVFVCRDSELSLPPDCPTQDGVTQRVLDEIAQLRTAGMKPTRGDIRCIVYGHLIRLAVGCLQDSWRATDPTANRLSRIAAAVREFGDSAAMIEAIASAAQRSASRRVETLPLFGEDDCDAVPL